MEKKRKRIQITDTHKIAARVASSAKHYPLKKTAPVEEEKDKEMNYLNKPHLQFR